MDIDKMYKKYAESHNYYKDGFLHVIPMEHSRESFKKEVNENLDFAEKWKIQ